MKFVISERIVKSHIRVAIVLTLALTMIISMTVTGCKPSPTSITSSGVSSNSEPTLSPTPTIEPTPTPIIEDTVVGRFFGPLYQAANPIVIQHNELRAMYIGAAGNLDANIAIAKSSDVNAFIVDVKESDGVYFLSNTQLAKDIGATRATYDPEVLVNKCRENNIKLIARIVCFKDYKLAEARPDLCIQDINGTLITYKLEGGKVFINPYKTEVWEYLVDIAKEAIALGFDEIQFDYVRFPVTNKINRDAAYNGDPLTVPTRIECINRFLTYAKIEIQDKLGVPLSADIFGIVMVSDLDGNLIGQDWKTLGFLGLDSLSPMIYPSHYRNGTVMNGKTFPEPDDDTFGFLQAMFIQEKSSEQAGYSKLRPYIQAYSYTQAQIFGQLDALAEVGINEYVYWNPSANYSASNVR